MEIVECTEIVNICLVKERTIGLEYEHVLCSVDTFQHFQEMLFNQGRFVAADTHEPIPVPLRACRNLMYYRLWCIEGSN